MNMMVNNPLIVAANLPRRAPQQESASLVPAHVNNAKEATALTASSRMFVTHAARK